MGTRHCIWRARARHAIGEFAVEYADQNRADYRAFVRAIREARIKAIVEGLRTFTRKDEGLLVDKVDINTLIETSARLVHNEVHKHADIELDLSPGVRPRYDSRSWADRNRSLSSTAAEK